MQEDYGGYAGRLRRLCTEKEKARERSVPDGSDKNSNLKYELSKKLHFLELLETPDLRSALREAYPPNSRRQSSSEEDGE